MNNNIFKIKKHLTIIFTIIVSLIIIILWTSFLSLKYYKDLNNEKKLLDNLWEWIEKEKLNIDKFINLSRIVWNKIKRKDVHKRFNREFNLKYWKNDYIGPLSYIKFKNDEIISYNIEVDIKDTFIKKIFDSSNLEKSFELDWFLIRKINLKNETIIVFKKIRYDIYNYIGDIFIFILITFIFSSLLYFIWNKFINKIFIPVEENIKDINSFIHNAGYELKTPISVIDSNIQLIKDIKKYDEPMLDEMKNETKKLNSLINSLIKLSDIWGLKVWKDEVNLKDLINEILNNCKKKLFKNNIQVKVKIKKDIIIEANRNYFYILLSNLIWNAIKYNINDWKIDISYKNNQLIIKDSWVWIPTIDFNKIFDRFYKIDESRNTEGFGIWLSLVKKISDIYNWSIEVKSKEGKWSSFMVNF